MIRIGMYVQHNTPSNLCIQWTNIILSLYVQNKNQCEQFEQQHKKKKKKKRERKPKMNSFFYHIQMLTAFKHNVKINMFTIFQSIHFIHSIQYMQIWIYFRINIDLVDVTEFVVSARYSHAYIKDIGNNGIVYSFRLKFTDTHSIQEINFPASWKWIHNFERYT